MTQRPPEKAKHARDLEEISWCGALYVLAPGLVLGSLAEQARDGLSLVSVLLSLLVGLGGLFVAASHFIAADKAGARFLIPVIGALSALVGLVYLAYGLSVFVGVAP